VAQVAGSIKYALLHPIVTSIPTSIVVVGGSGVGSLVERSSAPHPSGRSRYEVGVGGRIGTVVAGWGGGSILGEASDLLQGCDFGGARVVGH
jgi:hypothetical protein